MSAGGLGIWSRGGHEWSGKVPSLAGVTDLGELVVDAELVVVTAEGRIDVELLGGCGMCPAGQSVLRPVVSLYVFAGRRGELTEVIRRCGRRHTREVVSMPEHCLEAQVGCPSRTRTHGQLREDSMIAAHVFGHFGPEEHRTAHNASSIPVSALAADSAGAS